MELLNRIAKYFTEWDGEDSSAPKMELSIHDLRFIASMNVELHKLEAECRTLKHRYMDGMKVHYRGDDADDGIECPFCGYEVARNDDYSEMRPMHCQECGTKLIY